MRAQITHARSLLVRSPYVTFLPIWSNQRSKGTASSASSVGAAAAAGCDDEDEEEGEDEDTDGADDTAADDDNDAGEEEEDGAPLRRLLGPWLISKFENPIHSLPSSCRDSLPSRGLLRRRPGEEEEAEPRNWPILFGVRFRAERRVGRRRGNCRCGRFASGAQDGVVHGPRGRGVLSRVDRHVSRQRVMMMFSAVLFPVRRRQRVL